MRKPLVIAALVAVAAFSTPAGAKPFAYDDAKGDMPVGGVDIVSVSYATTGTTTTTKVRGRKVTTYTPTQLVVTLALADVPVEQPGLKYKVEANVEGCGTFALAYAPGTVYAGISGPSTLFLGCGSSDPVAGEGQILFPKFSKDGNKLVWTLSLKTLPKNVRAGSVFTGHNASVDVVEPILGVQGLEETGGPALLDSATSTATWTLG
ncbi:MAG TPA: hypothetical protein VGX28_09010 [Frankiaceae bacterium]|jgi:hypothetical protein|nr:hypothetical protein [Frankiaceae bacterium]